MNQSRAPAAEILDPQQALQDALAQFPGIIWTTDAQGVITSAFGNGMAQLGLTSNETVGITLAQYFGTDDPHFPVLAAHRRVMQGELQIQSLSWQGRDFESRMQPLRNATGEVVGCLGISHDVTQRNRSAQALPPHVAVMQAGIERAPDYVMHVDRAGTITYAESSRPDYQPDLVIGTQVSQWLRPETLSVVETAMRHVFVDKVPQHLEIPAPTANASDRWYDIRLRPIIEREEAVGMAAVAYDITERKNVELRLREQVELLAQVLANIPRGVMWKSKDGVYLGCNESFARFVGVEHPSDVIGRRDEELPVSHDFRQWLRCHDRAVLEQNATILDEQHTLQRSDGTEGTFSSSRVPLRDSAGQTVGVLGTLTDITERRTAEKALQESEERFRLLAKNLPGVVYLCRNDNRYTMMYLNDAVESLTGHPQQDFLEDRISFIDLYHPDEAAGIFAAVDAAIARREPFRITYRLRHRDGTWRWIEEFGTGVYRDDTLVMLEGFLHDVTERKQYEQQLYEAREALERRVEERTNALTVANERLRDEERRLQSILDNTTAVVYVKDADGRYVLINSQFARLFHVTPESVLGKTDVDIFPAELAARFRANDLQVQREHRAIQFEEVAPHDDGLHHYISVKFPISEAPGGLCAVCGISTDITDRKVSEQRLLSEERLLRRLLELRERERMLLAYDIHDGLVQDIVGAKMILEGRGRKIGKGAQLDQQSYERVLQLLVQAIDEGRRMISELRPPILDEQGIIGSIEYLVAEHLQKADCRIRFEHDVQFNRLSPLLEQTVFRIVQEALNNVVRHSAAQEADVRLRQSGSRIGIEVQDHGAGFVPADVPADRFGLRGIVERARLFGGTATIESQPGAGTRIVVDLPIDHEAPAN